MFNFPIHNRVKHFKMLFLRPSWLIQLIKTLKHKKSNHQIIDKLIFRIQCLLKT